MSVERFVLFDEDAGVYLGSAMGMGFWSKWDSVGQDSACTFESPAEAREHVDGWDDKGAAFKALRFVSVEATGGTDGEAVWATVDDCARAGLPRWAP